MAIQGDIRMSPEHHEHIIYVDLQNAIALNARAVTGRTLDYGCGTRPHLRFFQHVDVYDGADFPPTPAEIALNDDGTLPVGDDQFDAVLSFQVLEHVQNVGLYLSECHRVLRPGGVAMLSTHGIWPYHLWPIDLWRWTHDGLHYELTRHGFTQIRIQPVTWGMRAWLQLGLLLIQQRRFRGDRHLVRMVNWFADRFVPKAVTEKTWYQLPIVYLCLGYKHDD